MTLIKQFYWYWCKYLMEANSRENREKEARDTNIDDPHQELCFKEKADKGQND